MASFKIYDSEVVISDEKITYYKQVNEFKTKATEAANKAEEIYRSKFKNIYDVCNSFVGCIQPIYIDVMKFTLEKMIKNEIYSYDLDKIRAGANQSVHLNNWCNGLRNKMNVYNSVQGDAIVDSVSTVDTINTFGEVGFLDVISLVGSFIDISDTEKKLKELYNSYETISSLRQSVFSDVMEIELFYRKVMIKEKNINYGDLSRDEMEKSKSILNNLKSGLVPEEQRKKIWVEAIESYSNDMDLYEYALSSWGNSNCELDKIWQAIDCDISPVAHNIVYKIIVEEDLSDSSQIDTIRSKIEYYLNIPNVNRIIIANRVISHLANIYNRQLTADETEMIKHIYINLFDLLSVSVDDFPAVVSWLENAEIIKKKNEIIALYSTLKGKTKEEAAEIKKNIIAFDLPEKITKSFIDNIDAHIFNCENESAFEIAKKGNDTTSKSEIMKLINELNDSGFGEEIRSLYSGWLNRRLKYCDDVSLSEICKSVYTADESSLNEMQSKIEASDADNEIKQKYIKIISTRIAEIWALEDGKRFCHEIRIMNIGDPSYIQGLSKFISTSGRTEYKNEFVEALLLYNEDNYRKIQGYLKRKNNKLLSNINVGQDLWDKMTIRSSAINPALVWGFGPICEEEYVLPKATQNGNFISNTIGKFLGGNKPNEDSILRVEPNKAEPLIKAKTRTVYYVEETKK